MNVMYKCLLFGAVLALLLGGVAEATPVVDDFSTDTSASYTGSNSYGSGGSFTVNEGDNGVLKIELGYNNTYSVVRTLSALGVGERYAIDVGEAAFANDAVNPMVTTSLGQPNGSDSFGYRFRQRKEGYQIRSYGSTDFEYVTDFVGPVTLWIDRVTATDFRFYAQKPGGNRILIAEESNAALAGVALLNVGMQAYRSYDTSRPFDFDNLMVEAMPSGEQTVSFRKDVVSGYTGTVDTYLDNLNPDTDWSAATELRVRNDSVEGYQHTLLRFDDIIGSGDGQIPLDSNIVSATLWLQTGDDLYDGTAADTVVEIYRLLTGFSNGDTWNNSFGGDGVDTDGVEAMATADFTLGPDEEIKDGQRTALDVTASLQAWVDGQDNEGWLITESVSNRWVFNSSEGSTVPVLTVTFSLVGDDIPGDANRDGIVNDEDASILAAHWQQTGMNWEDGDFNDDGLVNDEDASILAAHWLESNEGGAPVPEPSSLVLFAGALFGWLFWRAKWCRSVRCR